jgi:hypothetical protein
MGTMEQTIWGRQTPQGSLYARMRECARICARTCARPGARDSGAPHRRQPVRPC